MESTFMDVPISKLDRWDVQIAIMDGTISHRLKQQMDEYWKEEEMKKGQSESPKDTQVGGSHYKKYAVQPIEYALKNGLNFAQANAIKYVTRYRDKNGAEDLRKAIHNIELLLEFEYGEKK